MEFLLLDDCMQSCLCTMRNESVHEEPVIMKQGGDLGWSLQSLRGVSAELLPLHRDRVAARGTYPGHLGFYLFFSNSAWILS